MIPEKRLDVCEIGRDENFVSLSDTPNAVQEPERQRRRVYITGHPQTGAKERSI